MLNAQWLQWCPVSARCSNIRLFHKHTCERVEEASMYMDHIKLPCKNVFWDASSYFALRTDKIMTS